MPPLVFRRPPPTNVDLLAHRERLRENVTNFDESQTMPIMSTMTQLIVSAMNGDDLRTAVNLSKSHIERKYCLPPNILAGFMAFILRCIDPVRLSKIKRRILKDKDEATPMDNEVDAYNLAPMVIRLLNDAFEKHGSCPFRMAFSNGDDSKTTDFNYAVLDFENLTLDLMVVLSLTLNALSQNTRGSPTYIMADKFFDFLTLLLHVDLATPEPTLFVKHINIEASGEEELDAKEVANNHIFRSSTPILSHIFAKKGSRLTFQDAVQALFKLPKYRLVPKFLECCYLASIDEISQFKDAFISTLCTCLRSTAFLDFFALMNTLTESSPRFALVLTAHLMNYYSYPNTSQEQNRIPRDFRFFQGMNDGNVVGLKMSLEKCIGWYLWSKFKVKDVAIESRAKNTHALDESSDLDEMDIDDYEGSYSGQKSMKILQRNTKKPKVNQIDVGSTEDEDMERRQQLATPARHLIRTARTESIIRWITTIQFLLLAFLRSTGMTPEQRRSMKQAIRAWEQSCTRMYGTLPETERRDIRQKIRMLVFIIEAI